jgi:DNA-binding response OmpR family regulator
VLFVDESLARIPTINAKEIRRLSHFLPVIVLIHKSTIKNMAVPCKIAVSKPHHETSESTKLLGLVGQAMEQFKTTDADSVFVFGDVTVSLSSMGACRKGEPVVLTSMEFKALKYFIQNARRVISRNELLNEVWGYENYPCTRTVDNHILRLRQKLEREPSRPVHFRTVHGAGYKFLP